MDTATLSDSAISIFVENRNILLFTEMYEHLGAIIVKDPYKLLPLPFGMTLVG